MKEPFLKPRYVYLIEATIFPDLFASTMSQTILQLTIVHCSIFEQQRAFQLRFIERIVFVVFKITDFLEKSLDYMMQLIWIRGNSLESWLGIISIRSSSTTISQIVLPSRLQPCLCRNTLVIIILHG
jgi:hypothetical protein